MRTLLPRALRTALLPIALLACAPPTLNAADEDGNAPPAGTARAANPDAAAAGAADAPGANVPAPAAPRNDADVPVKQVVLFSSGVGYFEHFGRVRGDGTTELRFQTEQINDVLKSLMLQDLDGGRAGTVSYPSQEPIEKTLKSFQVDIAANPGLEELLNQLRGARLTATLAGGPVTGMIVGVQKRPRPVPPDAPPGTAAPATDVSVLNLKTGRSIRAIPMDEVRDFALEDPRLDAELEQALTALAQSRDQDKKPVSISFRGEGERRVRIGYVVETPIWKTSYRLILGRADGGDAGGEAGQQGGAGEGVPGGAAQPKTGRAGPDAAQPRDAVTEQGATAAPEKNNAADQRPPARDGNLQGWAIVENQTDSDWTDVQLSLVSGRPISFIQHLYLPLYAPRPVVWPELYASLRPQTYEGGITEQALAKLRQPGRGMMEGEVAEMDGADAPDFSLQQSSGGADGEAGRASGGGGQGQGGGRGLFGRGGMFGGGGRFGNTGGTWRDNGGGDAGAIDPAASVIAAASAGQLGELFQYTVGNVTLPRQRSAMIPIVTDALEVERVSIYNHAVLPNHPLTGARLKNTTGKHLLQGPVTVLDGGAYAGDARIDDVPPGQERLLSYGIDLQVRVQREEPEGSSTIQRAQVAGGVLTVDRREVYAQTYVAQNKSTVDKQMVFEVASVGDDYRLVEPARADEKTEQLYRFRRPVAAGQTVRFKVVMDSPVQSVVRLDRAELDDLEAFVEGDEMPAAVREALAEPLRLRRAISDLAREINERQSKIAATATEQQRMRDNMAAVAEDSEYYLRLLKKLDEQETAIETIQREIADRQAKQAATVKQLAEHLATLKVDGV